MNYERVKKYAYSLAAAAIIALSLGVVGSTTVQAQNRDWDRDRWEDRCERREEWGDWQRRDDYGYGGYDNGRYGNYGSSREEEKGYRDGLDRGQKDAKTRRIPDPNNSSHYRDGNRAYRAGFRRGYEQGYRQYAYNRRRW